MSARSTHAILALVLITMVSHAGCRREVVARVDLEPIRSMDQLDWLAGHWIQESGDGSAINEEVWLPPRGGMMVGVNRTVEDGRAVFFEYLMIREVEGRIAYLAMPGGRTPPTVFPLVPDSAGQSVLFENPDHDFPRTIRYFRDGDTLTATLTGTDGEGERTETWRWRRAP